MAQEELKLFIIIWHHRHGIDAGLVRASHVDALERITDKELINLTFSDTDFNEGDKARLKSGSDQLEIIEQTGEIPTYNPKEDVCPSEVEQSGSSAPA